MYMYVWTFKCMFETEDLGMINKRISTFYGGRSGQYFIMLIFRCSFTFAILKVWGIPAKIQHFESFSKCFRLAPTSFPLIR